ncbi:MAG TPA: ferritin-like domain-containing protein [Polyangiaceae bacterium]|jgi:hypothetical protein
MKSLFEIEWCGGPAEKHFRKLRPFASELPWGTLAKTDHPAIQRERARRAWSSIAISEYRAAAAMADVLAAMLAARVPLDLVGMAGDFVADELMHVELASRLAMELGGGAPIHVDFESMGLCSDSPSALERANDLVVRLAISETLSGAIAVETRSVVEHPLVAAIVERIARDEARHERLGWLYLDWAAADMTDDERARVAAVARAELERIAPTWQKRANYMHSDAQARDFGWLGATRFRERAERTVRDDIVAPLAKLGIVVDFTP